MSQTNADLQRTAPLDRGGRLEEAPEAPRRAVGLDPKQVQALAKLGEALGAIKTEGGKRS